MASELTVGCYEMPLEAAKVIIHTYTARTARLRRKDFYAWPYYDGYNSGSLPDELNDGDLLAPVLLNVNPAIHGFASLRSLRPELEAKLADVPDDVDLAHASDAVIDAVARLFECLDGAPVLGVRGTTLSKVLHRKRPRLIPLHDRHVRAAYVPSRLAAQPGRSWPDYMTGLMVEMRTDLGRAKGSWRALASIPSAEDPELTHLRALDILAWWHGSQDTDGASSSDGE